jgi:uncharacterized membrane protein YgcG
VQNNNFIDGLPKYHESVSQRLHRQRAERERQARMEEEKRKDEKKEIIGLAILIPLAIILLFAGYFLGWAFMPAPWW